MVACGASGLVVIDPTCIDYLAPKRPRVLEHSEEAVVSEGVTDAWAAEMLRIQKAEQNYRLFDLEHLIERALRVSRSNPEDVIQAMSRRGHRVALPRS